MSIITLTDRISVSVRAKNDSQASSQKRDTGKNIAKALGNDSISDELADQLGATTKPTITDENGNEWISMEDIIAAGRKMKENGAFGGEEVHEGIEESGVIYTLSPIYTPSLIVYTSSESAYLELELMSGGTEDPVYIYFTANSISDTRTNVYLFSKSNFKVHWVLRKKTDGSSIRDEKYSTGSTTVTINDISYSYFYATGVSGVYPQYPGASDVPGYGPKYTGTLEKYVAGYLFGPTHTTGGSLVDWDAPNAEVERQINNLHETWDVSEHEGAVTANGTYVLAGPIEFNPGD